MESDRKRIVVNEYTDSRATVRVGGNSRPNDVAVYAYGRISEGLAAEFLVLGANASHQAAKAMADLRQMVLIHRLAGEVSFIPERVMIQAWDQKDSAKTNLREALVFRTLMTAELEEVS